MGIASLKPYNLIGVQNKLDRLYGRKLSLRGQFSFATRFLKEKAKESIYEKPYLDLSRPQMHQDPPTRDWPSDPPPPVGIIPPVIPYPPGDEKYRIYIFAPGIVSIFIHGPAECEGDPPPGNATVSLQAQHSEGSQNVWKFTSSDERVRIINETYWPPWSETSVDFNVEVDWDAGINEELEVQMCARVKLRGDLVRKIAVPMFVTEWGATYPMPGWEGTPQEPPTVSVLPLEIWTDYVYPEECTELIVEACCDDTQMVWAGPGTIGDEATVDIAIEDPTGNGGPYTWTEIGTDFQLLHVETEGLTNQLHAGSNACGTCTVTVTGCDGGFVKGFIRSLNGTWDLIAHCVDAWPGGACGTETISDVDGYKYVEFWCTQGTPTADCDDQLGSNCFKFGQKRTDCDGIYKPDPDDGDCLSDQYKPCFCTEKQTYEWIC